MPLVLEELEERPILHLRQDFHRNSSCHVHPAQRQYLQRQVSRLRSVNLRPQVQRLHTNGTLLRQRALGNKWRRVSIQILKHRVLRVRPQKFMNGSESTPGKNQLPTHLRIALPHELQQFDLLVRVRCIVGMSAFAGYHAISLAIPKKYRFSQPSPRCQQRARRSRHRLPRIQHHNIFRRQMLQAVPPRAKIVHQCDGSYSQFVRKRRRLNHPGKIRRMDAVVDHRPGHPEPRGAYFAAIHVRRCLPHKFLDDQVEFREILAGKTLAEEHVQLSIFFREQRDIALGAANVTRNNHRSSRQIRILNRFKGYTTVVRRVPASGRTLLAPTCPRGKTAPLPSSPRSIRPGWVPLATMPPPPNRPGQTTSRLLAGNHSATWRTRSATFPQSPPGS